MKVLFAVSECVPFIKSGGLADVAGALPKELASMGVDVRVIMPKYGTIPQKYQQEMKQVAVFTVPVGWRNQYCGIFELKQDGVTYYFIDNLYYFQRDSLYGHYDDGERFSYFTRAILDSLSHLDFFPNILHCHDWHTAMIPFMLKVEHQHRPGYEKIRTVFTIHNLMFQGIFPPEAVTDLLNLHSQHYQTGQLEFNGNTNFMKGALVAADAITTVSPTYRNEILNSYFGERLEGVLQERQGDLKGILNGIDYSIYNPETNEMIEPYSVENMAGKAENKRQIQEFFHLPVREDVPVIGLVSRLTEQKGLSLIQHVFHEIMQEDVQFILLGSGEAQFENFFREMEWAYPEKVRSYIGFNEELAHRIYAGSDLFLMPSQFEPCGLGQLIAMKYGSLPIVRETGGLNDTVHSYDEETGTGNGFSFSNFNAHDMLHTVRRALHFYHEEPEVWTEIVEHAMQADYSWSQSAKEYMKLYEDVSNRRESHVF
ncbi:glycogen synthase GlgA [Domibacillus indicus]|uniref:glycogen synthase GlgA n=1 Tax=Domibacillus indicus TaxID=1437523 RepID=UPI00204136B1|nr:glycogen synthase GlgA [Domibacillus indicus]MCM3787040.1 glycogen synthase GlgA [Domibacillus indicus]